jgi:spore germination protein GerM
MGVIKMAAKKKGFKVDKKRKLLLVLRILLLTAAFLYLFFFFYNNYFLENKVKLYFSSVDANYLKVEERVLDENDDFYLQLFKELIDGPENKGLGRTIPQGSKLLDYQLEGKVLTLNFSLELRNNHWGGSTGETMTIYSIVNTYTSLEEIESVKILLGGEEVETLVGHLDLTQPLMYNQKLTVGN